MSPHHPTFRLPRVARFALSCAVGLATAMSAHAMSGVSAPAPTGPTITEHPADQTLRQGDSFTLSVSATGFPTWSCQWMKNGANLPGATNDKFTVSHAQPDASGTYTVVVSNKVGRVTSNPVKVLVVATHLPTVIRPPVSQTVPLGATARFEIVAAGSPEPAYQWRKDGINLPGATRSVLTLASVEPSDGGSYDVHLSNTRGAILSPSASLRLVNAPSLEQTAASPAPITAITPALSAATRILVPPAHLSTREGEPAAFTVTAAGENLTFQWKRNGLDLPGATAPVLSTTAVRPDDMGFYSVIVCGRLGTVESATAILAVSAEGTSRLINLSARGHLPAGGALTPGFTWSGPGPKNLLIRAVGPTLAHFGVTGALADPRLEIYPADSAQPSFTNDNWAQATHAPELTTASSAAGAFALATGSRDAAALASLSPAASRNHTARISATDSAASGTALAEIYDTDPLTSASRLTAISVLGVTGAGDSVLAAGFTLAGSAPKRVLIRAVGPGLAAFGVLETLPAPRLLLRTSHLPNPIARNDGWNNSSEIASASAAVGAFALTPGSKDAALFLTLPPGCYTVTADHAGDIRGAVLVEIYDLEP